ncbi:MAG: M1 family aminopeptidase, partial [Candidatus Stygibacter australis]|nr:M1 family aminopeptidase [Candidatus Stygibacter australis]
MFFNVFGFEMKYRLSKLSTWIYFVIFLILGILIVNALAGAFTGTRVMINSEKVTLNSPYINHSAITIFGLFGIFIVASVMGFSIYRDFEYNTYPMFFTKPVSKASYLLGRYFANGLILTFILSGTGLGMLVGQFCPWLDKAAFGPVNLLYYIYPYLVNVLPNVLFTGAIFFSLAFATRRMLPVYIAGIVLFVGYFIGTALFDRLEMKEVAALIDPMGMNAVGMVYENFSVVERNTKMPPFTGLLLLNRLIWLAAGGILMLITYLKFKFSQTMVPGKAKKEKVVETSYVEIEVPVVHKDYSWKQNLKRCLSFIKLEFQEIISSANFITIAFAGLILLVVSLLQSNRFYETQVLAITYNVTAVINANFAMISLIILLIYTGETLWKAREHKLDGILDSQPVPNWVYLFSKFTALLLVQFCLILAASIAGIIYQVLKGFSDINLGLYAANLGLSMVSITLLAALIFLVHILANNKFAGHALAIGSYFLFSNFSLVGLEHPLFSYGRGGSWMYSDMNGFGNMLARWGSFRIYWAFLAAIFLVVGLLFYPRGRESSFRKRWQICQQRYGKDYKIALIIFLVGFIGMGSYIFYNENVLNEFKRTKTGELEQVNFEKKYQHYDDIAQPRYTDVYVQVDIYPGSNRAEVQGKMTARNKTSQPIDSLIVILNTDLDYNYFSMDREYRANVVDTDYGLYSYKLASPLLPGEDIVIEYDCTIQPKGYFPATSVVENGTFFNSMTFFPHLGYSDNYELSSEEKRKKYGLEPKLRMAKVDDEKARMNTYISDDADWVNYEAILSTSIDQTAITPGYLQKEWEENGRKYFHYKMDHPGLNFFCYVSARYEENHDVWTNESGEDVELTIYYDHHHPYNTERMIKALKSGLGYFSKNFGPYPDRQVRILEFPRYSSYAQSFVNTIPYSESIGFVADVRENSEDIDYPYNVTAHELGHQWWAHQVIGANVQGSVLMSEALAQYSSLMVMEKEYGKSQIGRFLKHELSSYLIGRGGESREELPLYLVESQQYIYYYKGAVIMYALRDYCGEKAVNSALKKYLQATAYEEPPYTNSLEFMEYIEPIVPDSLNYIIDDWFKKITLYDNKMKKAECWQEGKRKYRVELEFEMNKYYADGQGNDSKAEMNDLVEIVIFGNAYVKGKQVKRPVYQKKHRLNSGEHKLTVYTKRKPQEASIDGMFKLIDKNMLDNSVKVKIIDE